jgi:sugar transferase (PEP-CTERM/EpsH1 system associated)
VRILLLTQRLPYAPNRGDRIRAHHLLRVLSERHEVDVVSLVHSTEEASHAAELRPWTSSVTMLRTHRIHGMVRCVGHLLRSRPLTHALLDAPAAMRVIAKAVAKHPPDVVLAGGSGVAQFALERPLSEFPLVLDMVDVDSEKWRALASASLPPKRWIYRREATVLGAFESTIARRAFATLVTTPRERDLLCALAQDARVYAIPNGIDAPYFHPVTAPAEAPVVVFCGVMNYQPNVAGAEWLVKQVWPRIRRARPAAELMIVGSEPSPRVQSLARTPGVTVTGRVDDVRPYLWHAAVSVAPLAVARGVQNKVLEAVAAGLPCVVTPVVADGLPAEALHACRVAAEPDAFARHVIDLLRGTSRTRRAMANAVPVASLSWPARLEGVHRILDDALSLQGQIL